MSIRYSIVYKELKKKKYKLILYKYVIPVKVDLKFELYILL